ncbi:MAG: bifunctional (p)ppGpp synthetase/guanosine-3',5'-bis(diphosphate) 3'-pyrophosphohydrolase [Oscillibacter sp.]|nr:bifunctional (p)ppGpp synthetase/guanosine-3',5'-bis(diphosphate) 3'-pyrophosphohydrolase [Oscillibacter sp.]
MTDGTVNTREHEARTTPDDVPSVPSALSVAEQYERLERTVRDYNPQADFALIRGAYEFAEKEHRGQLRKSGEPYIIHPIAVAQIVAELKLDSESLAAALLHDVIEDTPATHEDVARLFSPTVADIVEGVSKLTRIQYDTVEDEQMENFRKMLMAMNQDMRVIIIKICDRLHNMRTMDFQPPAKQRQKSLETMEIYVPISYRLGIRRIKSELEDLSLKYLDPIAYAEIMDKTERQRDWYEEQMRQIVEQIHDYLTSEHIDNEVFARMKHPYSIYRKTIMQNRSMGDIFDLFAYRVVVNTVGDCYHVLGLIHDFYTPILGHFKDYIGNPKPNGYQSLHTIVMGPHKYPFEVQIRTKEMHQVAEFGVAAHWKSNQDQNGVKLGPDEHYDQNYQWVQRLLENQDGAEPEDYIHSLKVDLFDDKVFVFTPKGKVLSLPAGATPIDYAYAIHSDVGNQMVSATVNHKIVPLDYALKNGDRVEIRTSPASKGPSRNWLQIAKSNQARSKIRQWFRREKRDENIVNGRAAFEEELKRYNLRLKDATTPEFQEILLKNTAYHSLEELYAAIGYGAFTAHKAAMRVENEYRRTQKQKRAEVQAAETKPGEPTPPSEPARTEDGIVVGGLNNCLVKFARCCAPVPGDEIRGFITKGYGVSVHRADCPNASPERVSQAPERWVKVSWGKNLEETYPAAVEAICRNRRHLTLDIGSALADTLATARGIHIEVTDEEFAICRLDLRVRNKEEVEQVMRKVMQVSGVLDVKRPAK